jgi:hypothetical protein
VRSFHKEGMKHGYSERMQLVPAQLMRLYDHDIDIFHTDPETGLVDQSARLASDGLSDGGGQELAGAQTSAEDAKSHVTSMGSLARPAASTRRTALIRGHRPRMNTELNPTALPLRQACPRTGVHALPVADQPVNDKMSSLPGHGTLIDQGLPDGLLIPTAGRCTTGSRPLLAARVNLSMPPQPGVAPGDDEPNVRPASSRSRSAWSRTTDRSTLGAADSPRQIGQSTGTHQTRVATAPP